MLKAFYTGHLSYYTNGNPNLQKRHKEVIKTIFDLKGVFDANQRTS
jgi:hypothetical protein